MIVVSKNIRYMRIFAGRGRQIQYTLPYTCVQTPTPRMPIKGS